MHEELEIYKKIEKLLLEGKDVMLTEVVPSDCKCQGKTKRVFRCPQAFEINMLLERLTQLRKNT